MGATNWHYFTPYDPSPEAALQRLRQELFAAKQFQPPARSQVEHIRNFYERLGLGDSADCQQAVERVRRMERYIESGADADLQGLDRQDRGALRKLLQLVPRAMLRPPGGPAGPPQSIDELLDQAAETGAHTVLDITRTAPRRSEGAAAPLSARQLERLFGTAQPTRAQVEAQLLDVWEKLNPWQAFYVVVYAVGQPAEYAFIGCSGD